MPCEAPVLLVLRRRHGPDEVDRTSSRNDKVIGWRAIVGGDAGEDEECDAAGALTSI